jgi:cell wall-associated NlpC family hydrolase
MFQIKGRTFLFFLALLVSFQPLTSTDAAGYRKKVVYNKYTQKQSLKRIVRSLPNVTVQTDLFAQEDQVAQEPEGATLHEEHGTIADNIIRTGEKYLRTPYRRGAPAGQTRVFDCSLFVQTVFQENGIRLPRSSRQQATVGTPVSLSQLKKGDLLFFVLPGSSQIGHAGIYAGDNQVLHTYQKGGVQYESLSKRWLKQTLVSAKRVL